MSAAILSMLYKVARKLLSVPGVLPRRDTSRDAESLEELTARPSELDTQMGELRIICKILLGITAELAPIRSRHQACGSADFTQCVPVVAVL